MFKLLSVAILISSLLTTGCFFQEKRITDTNFYMDTMVSITVYGNDAKTLEKAEEDAFFTFKGVADATNPYASALPNDIYALNHEGTGKPFKVNPILYTLLSETDKLNHKEINLALGNVINLWQAHSKNKTVPSKEAVAAALAGSLDKPYTLQGDDTVLLSPMAQLDLGAVAKGYGVDRVAKLLKENKGISSALINAGGNIMTVGTRKDGKPWKIGIQNPRDPEKTLGTLSLKADTAVATSGDYQRYYEVNGVRYHHIIDPATGFPAQGTISATAVSSSGFLADYYSTLLFVLPFPKAKALVEATDGLEAVIENAQGEIYVSPGLKNTFTKE